MLHQQLSITSDASDDPMFNSRLSRVVTKLFTRVIKAEESSLQPFSSVSIDTEAVICTLEDALVACKKAEEAGIPEDAIAASKHLANILLLAILKARGETASLRSQMDELGIDPGSSALGKLVESCATELGLSTSSPVRGYSNDVVVSSVSADVASLVSAVGSAPQGPEREAAIDELRKYKATHGDAELNNHLTEVSAAFRAFVLEQLSENTSNNQAPEPSKASSMSERIKNLRSKLNATEAVVQSAVEKVPDTTARDTTVIQEESSFGSGIPQPSPSKLPSLSAPSATTRPAGTKAASVRAFRDRLAAAQVKRTTGSEPESEGGIPQPTTTAGSRAAALRARLQAVKRQSEEDEY